MYQMYNISFQRSGEKYKLERDGGMCGPAVLRLIQTTYPLQKHNAWDKLHSKEKEPKDISTIQKEAGLGEG
jgi:hypothetical protein